MLNPRVVEREGCRYEVVESKVVESKFVEFMLHSRRGSSLIKMGQLFYPGANSTSARVGFELAWHFAKQH